MDQSVKTKYVYWEWRTIIILMIGYALFYFVRKNFSIAIPAMEHSLGLSKLQLGLFLTLNGIIYGFSRFINGILVDRYSKKWIMATGLLLSAIVNFAICFSPHMNGFMNLLDTQGKATIGLVYLIGSLWVVNGYLQGMGVPPCIGLMSHWVRPSELAMKQSIWNASHSIGAGLVAVICGFLLNKCGYTAWNLCFAVPAAIALVGVPLIIFGIKDDPAEAGLPSIGEIDRSEQGETEKVKIEKAQPLKGAAFKAVVNKMVFRNPFIWTLAITNFCIYVIRFTILDWGSSFLTQFKQMAIDEASTIVAVCELIGGILGMLLGGWVTDHVFKHRAHWTCFFAIICATVCFFLFWKSPSPYLYVPFLVLSAFFIYIPQALLGICASQQATKYAAATANGILGIFGYASTTVSGIAFGALASSSWGWNGVFTVALIFGAVGILVIATMLKAPATGYTKVNKILAEVAPEQLQDQTDDPQ